MRRRRWGRTSSSIRHVGTSTDPRECEYKTGWAVRGSYAGLTRERDGRPVGTAALPERIDRGDVLLADLLELVAELGDRSAAGVLPAELLTSSVPVGLGRLQVGLLLVAAGQVLLGRGEGRGFRPDLVAGEPLAGGGVEFCPLDRGLDDVGQSGGAVLVRPAPCTRSRIEGLLLVSPTSVRTSSAFVFRSSTCFAESVLKAWATPRSA